MMIVTNIPLWNWTFIVKETLSTWAKIFILKIYLDIFSVNMKPYGINK